MPAVDPHGYASPPFEFRKQVFDFVALLVLDFTVCCGMFAFAVGGIQGVMSRTIRAAR